MRVAPVLALFPLALVVLTGCTFSANLTASASKVASTAEDALEQQVNVRPTVDCGSDNVDLVVGTVVDCVTTDDATGDSYDTTVTISKVDGSTFTVSVQVAGTPQSGPTSTTEPTGQGGAVITVPAEDIASVAVGALTSKLGYTPAIHCSNGIDLVVGNSILCMFTAQDGTKSTVNIEITKVDGTDYSINAVVN